MDFDFNEIDAIINAGSLAIVGASNKPMKFGSLSVTSQLAMGFKGPIYMINPKEQEVMGCRCYPDLRSLPETPDLVLITIPAGSSMDVLSQCAEIGVKGVIMQAAGFRETGPGGAELEEQAIRLARKGRFKIVGPNCFGIYNPRNRLTLLPGHDFSTTPGDVAFISQSGGLSAHMAREGKSLGIGFSAIVSYGNAADLNETDLLRYFTRDDQTGIIAGYLEGVKDGRAFTEALCEASSSKPVIIWKVGGFESSVRAVASHTASMAGSRDVWSGLMKQCGALEASGIDDICDLIIAIKKIGRDPGRRVLISGGGGGLGAHGAELAEAAGLSVPPLDETTRNRLRKALGRAGAVVSNPLDIGAPLIPFDELEASLTLAASNSTTDIMVFDLAVNFGYGLAGEPGLERAADILIEAREKSGRPVVGVFYSRSNDPDDLTFEKLLRGLTRRMLDAGVAVYRSMPRAIRAIAAMNTGPQ